MTRLLQADGHGRGVAPDADDAGKRAACLFGAHEVDARSAVEWNGAKALPEARADEADQRALIRREHAALELAHPRAEREWNGVLCERVEPVEDDQARRALEGDHRGH